MVVSVVPRASALLLASLAACAFDAPLASGYRCSAGDTCPSGEQCIDNRCMGGAELDAGADGGLAIDADDAEPFGIDGGGPRFFDDFSDGVLDGWSPWGYPGCTGVETGGALQLDFVANDDTYCGVDTTERFDLRTGAVRVEVVQAPAVTNFETYVYIFSSGDQDVILMDRDGANLIFQIRHGGTVADAATIDDPGDRFWRIRQDGSATIWETSDDNASWIERFSSTEPIDASAMTVELAAGAYETGTATPSRVRFDRLTVD